MIHAVLENYDNAPIDERMKETLRFIEKLTLHPARLNASDLKQLKTAGIPKEALEEAINICAVFCTINRLADAFDFELSPKPDKVGKFLFKNGYGAASLPG